MIFIFPKHSRMGHSIKFSLKTICAAIFDCSTVLLFASTLFRFLILFLPVKRFAIIQLVCLLYFTFFYVYRQQTLGQSAFGIALITKDKKRPTLVQIFIRVFTKAMICCIITKSLLVYSNPTFILTSSKHNHLLPDLIIINQSQEIPSLIQPVLSQTLYNPLCNLGENSKKDTQDVLGINA